MEIFRYETQCMSACSHVIMLTTVLARIRPDDLKEPVGVHVMIVRIPLKLTAQIRGDAELQRHLLATRRFVEIVISFGCSRRRTLSVGWPGYFGCIYH